MMFPRLPLSAKILLWFFLNLAVLTAVFLLLFKAQFPVNLERPFASHSRHRVETIRHLLVDELNNTSPDDWESVLEHFSEAYRARFALFDEKGQRLIGAVDALPEEVRAQLPSHTPVPRQSSPAAPAAQQNNGAGHALIHTTNPDDYWLLISARVDNPQLGGPLLVRLVIESSTPSVGGLIADPAPWPWLAVGAVIFSVLFWLPLLRGLTRSIQQVTHATREIAEGRFDARVKTQRRDELGALAAAINRMAERLDGLMKGQRRFLGDVAHELCSPLARLQIALGIIEQRADDGHKAYAKAASEKADQIARLVDELLAFSRASHGGTVAVRCETVLVRDAVAEAIQREAPDESVDLQLDIPPQLTVRADPELLVRALDNLLRNAIRYSASAGPIIIRASHAVADGGVTITVADSGPGVPEAELSKIFDAFYRVDVARARETGGTGLGLAIVKACIDSCSGTVSARNRKAGGLEVQIHLPNSPASVAK